MLSAERNAFMTKIGPSQPMGEYFRRFWLPLTLSEQLEEPDGEPVRLRLLGEDLVAFRDTNGQVGVVEAFCPHRRAPMFFGRNEECGLRCVYHGWKFDVTGTCVDMPSEPPESDFKHRVRIGAYPAREFGDTVWVYMGPGTPPELPRSGLAQQSTEHWSLSTPVINVLQQWRLRPGARPERKPDGRRRSDMERADLDDQTRRQSDPSGGGAEIAADQNRRSDRPRHSAGGTT